MITLTDEFVLTPILGELYGLEKFWAFRKYYKHSRSLEISDELRKKLDKYTTVDDFRLDVSDPDH